LLGGDASLALSMTTERGDASGEYALSVTDGIVILRSGATEESPRL